MCWIPCHASVCADHQRYIIDGGIGLGDAGCGLGDLCPHSRLQPFGSVQRFNVLQSAPGATEVFTPDKVKNSAQGIQVVVTGLSPISVGWTAPATTPDPSSPGR